MTTLQNGEIAPDLFGYADDVCSRKHGGVETSMEANLRVDKMNDRRRVLALIQGAGGYTLDQVSAILERPPNQISGRFSELAAAGLICRTSERRKTRAGSSAYLWKAAST